VNATAHSAGSRLIFRLATNTAVQIGGSVAGSVISFGTFIAVTRGLGPDAFGNLTAATVFLFIPVVLADVGLSTAVLREISASPDRTERVMRASVSLRALVSLAAVATIVALGLTIPFNADTKAAIIIGSAGALFTLLDLSLLPVLQAQLRMHWAVAATVAGRLTTLALTVGALSVGLGFKSVVAALSIGSAVTFVTDLIVVSRHVHLRPVIDFPYWRTLVRGSVALGLALAVSQIYFRVDALLLALIRPASEVGLYGAAYKFIELSVFVTTAVGLSVFPTLARFVSSEDPRLRPLVQKTFDVLLTAATPIVVLMMIFSSEIIVLTSGPEFERAEVALQLLAPYPLMLFVSALFWRVLIASHQDLKLLGIAGAILLLNVILNIAFLPLYGFKAAAVIAVATEAFSLTLLVVVLHRTLGFVANLRYAGVVLVAAAFMSAVAVAMPGPAIVAAMLAVLVYVLALLVAPGTVRDTLKQVLSESRRPRPQE
jgi:O-antigen/teichoic acid export membrane protein